MIQRTGAGCPSLAGSCVSFNVIEGYTGIQCALNSFFDSRETERIPVFALEEPYLVQEEGTEKCHRISQILKTEQLHSLRNIEKESKS